MEKQYKHLTLEERTQIQSLLSIGVKSAEIARSLDRSASTLGRELKRNGWQRRSAQWRRCHAYCQMTNHYHVVIETPEGNLAQGMRQLNGVYTQTVNRTHERVGHVFQGRYKAILVEKDSYLLELWRATWC